MMLNMEDQYAGLKQNNNESLLLYKIRIEHTLRMYDAIGVTSTVKKFCQSGLKTTAVLRFL